MNVDHEGLVWGAALIGTLVVAAGFAVFGGDAVYGALVYWTAFCLWFGMNNV